MNLKSLGTDKANELVNMMVKIVLRFAAYIYHRLQNKS